MIIHVVRRLFAAVARPLHNLLHRLQDSPDARRKQQRELLIRAFQDGFKEMSEKQRMRFLLQNLDLIPLRFWARPELARVQRGKLDYQRGDIYLRITSTDEIKRCSACVKEPWTVEWIEAWIRPGDVLYDVGANVGGYSLIAATHTGGQARIFAFEPAFHTYAALCDNILRNGRADCITPFPVALSSANGLASFDYRNLRPGSARHRLQDDRHEQADDFTPAYRQPILTYRLDDFVKQYRLPHPNHIKIDVDGAEAEVLEGAQATLASPETVSIMIEVQVRQAERVLAILERLGFTLCHKYHQQKDGRFCSIWYGLFARQGREAAAK